ELFVTNRPDLQTKFRLTVPDARAGDGADAQSVVVPPQLTDALGVQRQPLPGELDCGDRNAKIIADNRLKSAGRMRALRDQSPVTEQAFIPQAHLPAQPTSGQSDEGK